MATPEPRPCPAFPQARKREEPCTIWVCGYTYICFQKRGWLNVSHLKWIFHVENKSVTSAEIFTQRKYFCSYRGEK